MQGSPALLPYRLYRPLINVRHDSRMPAANHGGQRADTPRGPELAAARTTLQRPTGNAQSDDASPLHSAAPLIRERGQDETDGPAASSIGGLQPSFVTRSSWWCASARASCGRIVGINLTRLAYAIRLKMFSPTCYYNFAILLDLVARRIKRGGDAALRFPLAVTPN